MNKIVTGYGVPKKFGQKGSYTQSIQKETPPKPSDINEQLKMWLDGLNNANKESTGNRDNNP